VAAIVAIHGAYNEFWGPYELKSKWLPALRDGLWHHGVEIADSDFDVVFYGDLFRHDPEVEEPRKVQAEREAIAEFLHNYTADDLLGLLRLTEGASFFNRTIDLVAEINNDPNFVKNVHDRVRSVVKPDTRVIIAHSMGTLVAYGAIAAHPEWNVHTLITMGSPLGLPDTIAGLNPKPINGKGQWPGSIKRWVNGPPNIRWMKCSMRSTASRCPQVASTPWPTLQPTRTMQRAKCYKTFNWTMGSSCKSERSRPSVSY
jgi:pimeloyl-ACP methyl ester carboxylesterase